MSQILKIKPLAINYVPPVHYKNLSRRVSRNYVLPPHHKNIDKAETQLLKKASETLWKRIAVRPAEATHEDFLGMCNKTRTGFATGLFVAQYLNQTQDSYPVELVIDIEEEKEINFVSQVFRRIREDTLVRDGGKQLMKAFYYNWLHIYKGCHSTMALRDELLAELTEHEHKVIGPLLFTCMRSPAGLHRVATITIIWRPKLLGFTGNVREVNFPTRMSCVVIHLTRFKNCIDRETHAFFWQMAMPAHILAQCMVDYEPWCEPEITGDEDEYSLPNFSTYARILSTFRLYHCDQPDFIRREKLIAPFWTNYLKTGGEPGWTNNLPGTPMNRLAERINTIITEMTRLPDYPRRSPASLVFLAYIAARSASVRRTIQAAAYKHLQTYKTNPATHDIFIPFSTELIDYRTWHCTYRPSVLCVNQWSETRVMNEYKGITVLTIYSLQDTVH